MTKYLVATLSTYVLVEANDANEAKINARQPLNELLADACRRTGFSGEIPIQTVRPATGAEIELWNWHHAMLAQHAAQNKAHKSKGSIDE